jgi:tetratricopeptide (TPR) repeat protein
VRSLALFDEAAVDTRKANVLLSLCELSHARSRFDEASSFAVRALDLAARSSERATEAEAHVWLGRIAEERGDASIVDAEFGDAWGILDALGGGERLSRCHIIYADILQRRGDLAAANKHLRAAISQLRPARLGAAQMESRIASA